MRRSQVRILSEALFKMWNLYQDNKFLEPLKFSNGKSQEDVVKEVLDTIKKGNKIIFIRGICGTGKSAIALNIARKLGKSSIVVPGKNLQAQYKRDYEKNKYLIKENNEKLKISVITGRNNHKCRFLEDSKDTIPKIIKEVNSKLHDISEGIAKRVESTIGEDDSADNWKIPCKIEIKEKNWKRIKEYLMQNKKINIKNFHDIRDVKRVSVASVCPYWSPVIPERYELKIFENAKKKKYLGLNNIAFVFYQRQEGCKFYEQFNSFIDADILVFNSLKYKLESALNRKPLTEVEIIDECDEFLDSFSDERKINIDKLQNSLNYLITHDEKIKKIIKEMNEIVKQIKIDKRTNSAIYSGEILSLKTTGIYDLLRLFLETPELLDEIDEESYLFDVEETAHMFEDFLNETYLTFGKKDNNLIANLVTTNLEKKFKEIINKNKIIVLMSGTIHSDNVLRNVFGLKDFKIIEAETKPQGKIEIKRTKMEKDCKHTNLTNGKFSRKEYLKALDRCVEIAEKPVLVHVQSFNDLPTKDEIKKFEIKNLIERSELGDIQKKDKTGEIVEKFKKGKMNVLFSTRCARGIDFPEKECNSIVFTKYPNPDVKDAFWKILKKTQPQNYWDFYKDKARRELWQKIYRGLRSKDDHVFVLSPDSRVLNSFESI